MLLPRGEAIGQTTEIVAVVRDFRTEFTFVVCRHFQIASP